MAVDIKNRRYRLSVESEIIEVGDFSTTIHTHTRRLEVCEFANLEAARSAQSRVDDLARNFRSDTAPASTETGDGV